MAEILTPGVKHREKPDLRAEMSPIGSDGSQRLGGRVEQDLVDRAGILEGNRGDFVGNGEDDMEILGIEKFGAAIFKPFRAGQRLAFWAVTVGARNGDLPITCAVLTRCAGTRLPAAFQRTRS